MGEGEGGAEDRVSVTETGNWQTSDEQEVAICFYHTAPSYYLPLDCPGGRAENVSKRFWWNKERLWGIGTSPMPVLPSFDQEERWGWVGLS